MTDAKPMLVKGMALPAIIGRKEASARGLKRYCTGKPCVNGHVVERFVSDYTCVRCRREMRLKHERANPEANNARSKVWRAGKRSELADYDRQRYLADPAKYRTKNAAYFKANPEVARANSHARRARSLAAEGYYSAEDIARIRKSQRNRCAECRAPLKGIFHVDHIVPLTKGGTNWPRNIQILCPSCNLRKHAKDTIIWARENGRLL